jgi:hypothetical protein
MISEREFKLSTTAQNNIFLRLLLCVFLLAAVSWAAALERSEVTSTEIVNWYRLEVLDLAEKRVKVGQAQALTAQQGRLWRTEEDVQLRVYSLGKTTNLRFQHTYVEQDLPDANMPSPLRFSSTANQPRGFQLSADIRGHSVTMRKQSAGMRASSATHQLAQLPLFPRALALTPMPMPGTGTGTGTAARLNPMTGRVDLPTRSLTLKPGEFTRRYVNADIIFVPSTKAEASAPDRAFSPMALRAMRSPYSITLSALRGKIRYRLRIPEQLGVATLVLPETDEQRVLAPLTTRPATVAVIEVCAACTSGNSALARPTLAELHAALAPNPWVDNSHLLVRHLSAKLGGSALVLARDFYADSPAKINAKMRRLVDGVAKHMTGEISYFGHQSATQTARTGSGDCGEMAMLLAALAKSRGIPARVVTGFAYTRSFEGQAYVFAPHVWVQAWNGVRWQSFDAALGAFDAGHIALSVSNGAADQVPKLGVSSVFAERCLHCSATEQALSLFEQIRSALVLEAAGSVP